MWKIKFAQLGATCSVTLKLARGKALICRVLLEEAILHVLGLATLIQSWNDPSLLLFVKDVKANSGEDSSSHLHGNLVPLNERQSRLGLSGRRVGGPREVPERMLPSSASWSHLPSFAPARWGLPDNWQRSIGQPEKWRITFRARSAVLFEFGIVGGHHFRLCGLIQIRLISVVDPHQTETAILCDSQRQHGCRRCQPDRPLLGCQGCRPGPRPGPRSRAALAVARVPCCPGCRLGPVLPWLSAGSRAAVAVGWVPCCPGCRPGPVLPWVSAGSRAAVAVGRVPCCPGCRLGPVLPWLSVGSRAAVAVGRVPL